MKLETPNKLRKLPQFQMFLQKMLNRLYVGELRYGNSNLNKKYFTRAKRELAAYKLTGKREHLINAANYCALEYNSEYPEILHLDDNSNYSVTRSEKLL